MRSWTRQNQVAVAGREADVGVLVSERGSGCEWAFDEVAVDGR